MSICLAWNTHRPQTLLILNSQRPAWQSAGLKGLYQHVCLNHSCFLSFIIDIHLLELGMVKFSII